MYEGGCYPLSGKMLGFKAKAFLFRGLWNGKQGSTLWKTYQVQFITRGKCSSSLEAEQDLASFKKLGTRIKLPKLSLLEGSNLKPWACIFVQHGRLGTRYFSSSSSNIMESQAELNLIYSSSLDLWHDAMGFI